MYKVKEDDQEDYYEYAASIAKTEDSPNSLSVCYSFQPEYIYRKVTSNSTKRMVLSVIYFGAFYTLLSLIFNLFCKRKDFGKRDCDVCIPNKQRFY